MKVFFNISLSFFTGLVTWGLMFFLFFLGGLSSFITEDVYVGMIFTYLSFLSGVRLCLIFLNYQIFFFENDKLIVKNIFGKNIFEEYYNDIELEEVASERLNYIVGEYLINKSSTFASIIYYAGLLFWFPRKTLFEMEYYYVRLKADKYIFLSNFFLRNGKDAIQMLFKEVGMVDTEKKKFFLEEIKANFSQRFIYAIIRLLIVYIFWISNSDSISGMIISITLSLIAFSYVYILFKDFLYWYKN